MTWGARGACLAFAVLAGAAALANADGTGGAGSFEVPARGLLLYRTHCACCHGESGRGDGIGAALNVPRPRDFGTGKFRLVSTRNGVPSRADLFDTITRGVPGTGMPPWEHLSEEDRWALVDAVRALARSGLAESLREWAREEGEPMTLAESLSEAEAQVAPGDPVDPGEPPASTPERIERGRVLFEASCALCHGASGRGMRDPAWRTQEGEPISSRDLVWEPLKGGDDPVSLHCRIAAGIPGTPMPGSGSTMDRESIWDLVHYIRSIRRAPAQEPLSAWWLPVSANAQGEAIDHDFLLTFGVTGTLGILVLAALAAGVWRGIVRRGETPPYRPGSRWVEALWVAIPTAIVLAMIVNSLVLYADLTRELPGALRVKVTGRQFFWSFEYPESGAVSTGTCAIPAGRPVHFEIVSEDVIHSFFLPHLKMKRDAIPGFMTHLWARPIGRTGAYPILCNQFCGTDHAIMNGTLRVLPAEDFENWLALHRRGP